MKNKYIKGITLSLVFFSVVVGVLAFTPHYTCGCGQTEQGTQLTRVINFVSEKIIGRPIIHIEKKPLE
jgi:hypothetical protein